MKEERRNTLQARHRAIFSFWHRVEFFIPYDLQGQVLESKDADWSVRLLSRDQLERLDPQDLWSPPVPFGRRLSGFDVYLGIFDKVQLADITQRVLADTPSGDESLEQDERAELEGLTCAASLRANADGVLQLGEISVSTVPWALGTLSRRGLQGLDFDAFQASLEALKRDVATFRSTAAIPAGQDEGPTPCSPDDLLRLLDILRNWSGHDPSAGDASAPMLVIRAKSVEDKPKPEQAPKATPPGPDNESAPEADDAEDDEAQPEEDAEISILNSFFAEDIARHRRAGPEQCQRPAARVPEPIAGKPSRRSVHTERPGTDFRPAAPAQHQSGPLAWRSCAHDEPDAAVRCEQHFRAGP